MHSIHRQSTLFCGAPLLWLLAIGILVQLGWEAGLLLGGIRSAGFETLGEKLRTLVINSLLETNLGIPYMYLIYIAYRRRFTEQMKRREAPLSFRECIREENLRRVRGGESSAKLLEEETI